MPLKHERQPEEQPRSRLYRSLDPDGPIAFSTLERSYRACRQLIVQAPRTRDRTAGKEWVRIIDKRLTWLAEDRQDLQKRVERCVKANVEVRDLLRQFTVDMESVSGKLHDFYNNRLKKVAEKESVSGNDQSIQKMLKETYKSSERLTIRLMTRLRDEIRAGAT